MNRDEAKYILRAYHLGGRDAEKPQFRNALEMLKHDRELSAWFAEEQAIDQKLSKSFRTFPIPPGLEGQLLAGSKVIPPRAWWQRPAWLSAAACLALLGVLVVFLSRSLEKAQFVEFRSYVEDAAAKLDHLDLESNDLVRIRQWLSGHSAPENFAIPGKLNGRSTIGCRVFAWNGQKVSLVCFELQNKKVAHLFIVDRSALTGLPGGNIPHFRTSAVGIATASWADAQCVYMVAMKHGDQDLKNLFL